MEFSTSVLRARAMIVAQAAYGVTPQCVRQDRAAALRREESRRALHGSGSLPGPARTRGRGPRRRRPRGPSPSPRRAWATLSAACATRRPAPPRAARSRRCARCCPAIGVSRRAANVAMLTWSSWFAEVGSESTDAGCASDLFSDASAAAVTCAIMKPELTPPSATRNGGRPDRFVSIRSAMRRSDSAPISAIASATLSAANATGSAWKLPPERISSCVREHERIVGDGVRLGDQHVAPRGAADRGTRPSPAAGSADCTDPAREWQSLCDSRIALPASSPRLIAAASICPRWPRTS